jgi:hypothetical protein
MFSVTIVALAALVSLALTILTWMAAIRLGQGKIKFVAAAFGVHFVKSTIVAFGLFTGSLGHEVLEVIEAVFDLTMVTLLAIPFWARA